MEAVSSTVLLRPKPGLIPRRPALPAVLCIIAGIAFSFKLPSHHWIILSIIPVAALAAILFSARAFIASALIAIAFVCLGAVLGQSDFFSYPSNDIGGFSSMQPRLAQLELRIEDPPRLTSGVSGGRQFSPKQSATASVRRILTRNGWIAASGTLLVDIAEPHPQLASAQTVRVLGMLERPAHATNPGEFDWADHYRIERILTLIQIARTENIQILHDGRFEPLDWMRAWARDLLAMGFTDRHTADYSLLRALVLGDADPSMRESQLQFQKIGAAYLLSVSGMHIAVVAGCVYGICRLLMRSPRFAGWACLAIVLLYGAVVLPHESALRAVLLCCAVLLGVVSGRHIDKLQLLSIVAGILLVLNPMQLFDAGFQLGFLCIGGFILLAPLLLRWFTKRDRDDSSAISSQRRVSWRAWIWLRTWFAFSLVAWAVSMPIIAFYFGQMSPWSIPSGMVLFPIVSLALVGGCAKILLTLAWPSLAGVWAFGALAPLILMKHLSAALAHLPAAAVPVAPPSVGIIVIYVMVLSLPLFAWPERWLRRTAAAAAPLAVCGLIVHLSLGFPAVAPAQSASGLSITFLDIGAGQTAIVQVPNALPAIIDAGSSTISDVTRTALAPFLNRLGERRIGTVFLSHSDFDHISAVASASPIFGIGSVYTSQYFAHFASIDPPAQSLLDELKQTGKSPHLIGRGDHLQLSSQVAIDVLWPPSNCTFNCNNTGLVLRLTYAGRRILFPADIQADAMRELLKLPPQLKADVLIAAHHGSSEITTADFVAAVNPLFIISSNGSPLTQKQKSFERMIGNRQLYRTSNCGAITLHITADGSMQVGTFLPQHRGD